MVHWMLPLDHYRLQKKFSSCCYSLDLVVTSVSCDLVLAFVVVVAVVSNQIELFDSVVMVDAVVVVVV